MTEERKKELVKSYAGNIATCLSRKDWNSVRTVLEDLVDTIAAEAREDGIESIKLNSIVRITKHKERCSESGYSLGGFTEGLGVGIKVITEEAERLKTEEDQG